MKSEVDTSVVVPQTEDLLLAVSVQNRLAKIPVLRPKYLYWNRVLRTDESTFNLVSHDGRTKVRRAQNEALMPDFVLPHVQGGGAQ